MVRPLVSPIDKRSRELYGRHESRYKVAKTMQPFDAPISESGRDLYGEHEYRYKVVKQMQPFDAPISEHDRNLFGEYQPRYQVKKPMQPFDAQISERERELFGEYQSRYYQPKTYQPFGTPIDDYSRQIYGAYRSRYSRLKVGIGVGNWTDADGLNWVTADLPEPYMRPKIFDESIYQIVLTEWGGWVGPSYYRILIDGRKVYPFTSYEAVVSGAVVYLGTLSNNIRTGELCEIQFFSGNAGDTGPAQSMEVQLNMALFEG